MSVSMGAPGGKRDDKRVKKKVRQATSIKLSFKPRQDDLLVVSDMVDAGLALQEWLEEIEKKSDSHPIRVTRTLHARDVQASETMSRFPFERAPGEQRRLRIKEGSVISFFRGEVGDLFREPNVKNAQVTLKISNRPTGYTVPCIEKIEEWSAKLYDRMIYLNIPDVNEKCRTYCCNDVERSSCDIVCAGLRTASAFLSSFSADEEGRIMHKNLVTALISLIGLTFAKSNAIRVEDVFLGSSSLIDVAAISPEDV
jgi:hypothetical protein